MNKHATRAPLRRSAALSALLFGTLAAPAAALGQAPDDGAAPGQGNEDIVITAIIPRSHTDILGGIVILDSETLARDLRSSLGDTLARQPGVSATSFGPGASRPVLRGFSGDRIRILTDGIGSFDASATSADHAVAINPLLASRVEVLHGPAALLYGSSAVGGVVNVIDDRLPTVMPQGGFDLALTGGYGSAADERSLAGKTEIAIGDSFVIHADGTYLRAGDLRVGGPVLGPVPRAQALASDDPEIRALADLSGRLPNSALENWSAGGGVSYIGADGGSIGVAISRTHSTYGIPIRYVTQEDEPDDGADGDDHGHEHEAEQVRIALNQTRLDLRAVVPVNGAFLHQLRLRGGWADYEHAEIEESGEIGTQFFTKGLEMRLEAVQTRRGGWDGASGVQLLQRKSRIEGEEKFLPMLNDTTFGLFTLQSLDLGALRVEAGARFEHSSVNAAADADLGNPATDRDFDTISGSIGLSYAFAQEWRAGLNVSRTERAPTSEELFARGNHAGTQAFELGNPDFQTERGWGVEGTLHGRVGAFHITASAFYNDFDRFIYDGIVADEVCLAANGGVALEFPCFAYQQAGARYYGGEVQTDWTMARFGDKALKLDAMADYTRATLRNGTPLPRIPPLRVLGGATLEAPDWNVRLEAEHAFRQDRVDGLETPTAAFTLVNASLGLKPRGLSDKLSITLSANNIFDVDARRHASLLKDYAPLAGRDVRVTLGVQL